LRAHTLAPSILPLLEALTEGFFWNLLEFGRRIPFNVFRGCEMRLGANAPSHTLHILYRVFQSITVTFNLTVHWQ
jgi:hypothetical protein